MSALSCHRITESLTGRFALGVLGGFLVSAVLFIALYSGFYTRELARERGATANQIARLLQVSLENAMLKRDIDGLAFIVSQMGTHPGILAVNILSPAGEVRFSNHKEDLGRPAPAGFVVPSEMTTEALVTGAGREIMRSTIPVKNRLACVSCHGSVEQNPINGILVVDYDAATIRAQVKRTTLMLMGAGAAIVLVNLAGGWWFIRRFVLIPIRRLAAASAALGSGRPESRVHLTGRDEIARLGQVFDRMAENLEIAIREREERQAFLQALLDAIPDGVRVIDSQFRQILSNRAYRQQLGIVRVIPPDTHCYSSSHGRTEPCAATLVTCPLVELRQQEQPIKTLHRHVRADGTEMEVETYAAALRIQRQGREEFLVVESIRDLLNEVRYSHEQRLSELGKLAAGVAHEIHNPLASARIALHAARNSARGALTSEAESNLDLVDEKIKDCIEVTGRLLNLSVSPSSTAEPVNLQSAVIDTLSLLHWEAEKQGVSFHFEVPSETTWVMASDSAVRMIALNLAQNALHAMPRGGRLDVSIERNLGRIDLSFADNGVGIAPDDMQRIFEPFFSRRADGVRGTGLGLPICRSLAKQYSGTISVTSTLGEGTRFVVSFPDPAVEDFAPGAREPAQ